MIRKKRHLIRMALFYGLLTVYTVMTKSKSALQFTVQILNFTIAKTPIHIGIGHKRDK